ncbi:crotonase/enoyl-CoA hydratase family protein [Minwuia sp.]|uniref:crotonase/enoyl-CoA hydratase family protein n=1 Tax=Minwuia sp. TaxID=2493630 RepID=UPI003A931D15
MSVSLELKDGIALVTMDDGKANAVSEALLDALEPVLDEAEQKADAVILAGRPGKFCAGFDLKSLQGGDAEAAQRLIRRGGQMVHRLFSYPKPLVAAATGHGMALGALWLLACDSRIGARGAYKFGLNETAIGMVLPTFGLELARMRIPVSLHTEAVIQARIYDPAGAIAAGYLDQVVDEVAVMDVAMEAARELAKLPGGAYAQTKLNIRKPALDVIEKSLA